MATRRPRAEIIDDDGDGLTPQTAMPIDVPVSHEIDDEELTPAERVRALIGQAASDEGTKIKLYRIDPKTPGGMPWCADYTPEEFEAGDLEMIRRQWGAGRYHVRVINRRGIAARVDVTIAEPVNPPAAVAPAIAQNSELAQVMRVLAEGQARILDALSTRPDPTQEMQRMFALMAGMREAMGLNVAPPPAVAPASPQALLGDLVGAIKTLREISADVNPPAPADPDNPLALVGPIVELVKVARQNPQPLPMPIAPAPAPILPVTMPRQNAPARRPNPAPRPSVAPAPNGVSLPVTQPAAPAAAQPTPQPATEGETMNPALLMILNEVRALIRDMVQRASVGADIEEAAEILYEKLPDDAFDYLVRDDWFELFAKLAPEVVPHREWFDAVKVRLDEIIAEEDVAADDGETIGEAPPAPDDPVIVPGSAI